MEAKISSPTGESGEPQRKRRIRPPFRSLLRCFVFLRQITLMITGNSLTIAVDFDGTIVEHRYPKIGKEMLFAFDALRKLQANGHRLILWTIREGRYLEEAVEYCRANGVEFYAINKNYPEETFTEGMSRKVNADLYIDDRNVGGFPGWGEVYRMIHPEEGPANPQFTHPEAHHNFAPKPGWFRRILNLTRNQ